MNGLFNRLGALFGRGQRPAPVLPPLGSTRDRIGSIQSNGSIPASNGDKVHTGEIKMSFLSELEKILGFAENILPAIAAQNTANDPTASNNGVTNTAAMIALVQPLVDKGAAISAASPTPLTGAQLLDNVLQAVSVVTKIGTAEGLITQPEAVFVPIIVSAINTAVAIRNAKNAVPAQA